MLHHRPLARIALALSLALGAALHVAGAAGTTAPTLPPRSARPPSPSMAHAAAPPLAIKARLYLPTLQRHVAFDGAVTFAVIGDFGWCAMGGDDACAPETRVAEMVKGWDPAFIVTTGDNNYPRGKWDTWQRNTEPYRAYIPDRFEPAIGNHDYICSQCPDLAFRTNFQRDLTRQFAKPDERNPLLRFFMIDSNAADPDPAIPAREKAAERSPLADQRDWLEHGLAERTACWRLVVMHHPPYSSSLDPGSNRTMSSASGWNYRQWGADVVLAGHAHNYERILRPDGFAYIVDGAGGAPIEALPEFGVQGSVARVSDANGAIRGYADAHELVLEFYTIDVADPTAPPRLRDVHRVARDCNAPVRAKE